MNFTQLNVAQQQSVQRVIVSEWRRLQGYRHIVEPGAWHVCKRGACRMVQLACNVRLQAHDKVDIAPPFDRARDTVVVQSVFVCWCTGKVHVCGNTCQRDATGACTLTGHRHSAANSAVAARRGAAVGVLFWLAIAISHWRSSPRAVS